MKKVNETTKVTFRIPNHLLGFIDDEVARRGVDRTVVLIDAVQTYVDYSLHPEHVKDQIRQALREDPGLVAEAIQIYAARKIEGK